jgi:hypothetical protein
MRWIALPLAVIACSHSVPQPPPAPLAVPEQVATEVAQPVDGGAGPVSASPPDAGVEVVDLATPITAAGVEEPQGLTWPASVAQQPASATFKNVKVLGSLSSARFMAAMQSMQPDLGQKCVACHLVEQKDYASDDKKEKQRTRDMIRMTEEISHRTFADKPRVTCWMCHRGVSEPLKTNYAKQLPESFPKLSEEKLDQPAQKVFKDVRELKGMNARNFGFIMGWFSAELGVKCTYCHDRESFANDTAKKARAREMLQMTSYVASGYYGNDSPVGCGTCHRGQPKPMRTPKG